MKKWLLFVLTIVIVATSYSQSYVGFKNSTDQKIKIKLKIHFAYIKHVSMSNISNMDLSRGSGDEVQSKLYKEFSFPTLVPSQEKLQTINQVEEIFAIEIISDQTIPKQVKHPKKTAIRKYSTTNKEDLVSGDITHLNKFLTINGKYTSRINQGEISVLVEKYQLPNSHQYNYRLIYM